MKSPTTGGAILGILLLGLLLPNTNAATPPPGSPIAMGQHPRLFFTATELPALRDRITLLYQSEFQDFIERLNDTTNLPGNDGSEDHWGSLNFAFMAALDPQIMQSMGFSFSESLNTKQEYCDEAYVWVQKLLPAITIGEDLGHGSLQNDYPIAYYFPVMVAYDWCYDQFSNAEKITIITAFDSGYENGINWKGFTAAELLSANGNNGRLANNQETADIHSTLTVAAFYNDPEASFIDQDELYQIYHTVWIDRLLVEFNYFYGPGFGWHEGTGGYHRAGIINSGIPFAMISSAMGTNYFATTPFFNRLPIFLEANLLPQSTLSTCGASGTERCPEYLERWGSVSDGIDGYGCREIMLTSGMLRKAGHPNAALAKWAYSVTEAEPGRDVFGCSDAVTRRGNTWHHGVLYWFMLGDREITAQSADQMGIAKSQKLGLGEYIFRSSYGTDASRVVFWSTLWNMYGHVPLTQGGTFSLYKFGNLIVNPGNKKSGRGVIDSGGMKNAVMRNMVGIHKGSSDPTLAFNGDRPVDPFWEARGITKVLISGKLLAEDIDSGSYDYVAHDHTIMYDPGTTDLSQREFVSLRGPLNKEYLVVLDRVNVANPATDEKLWNIWVPHKPEFENGTSSNPRVGKWTSSNADTVSMTNQFSNLDDLASSHGKFYLKTLSPDNVTISFFGGPGKEFQSADDDGTTPWGAPALNQSDREFLGWGRIEVKPAVAQNYDIFLHVIQYGESTTLTSMSSSVKVSSTDDEMLGAHIKDAGNQWVVMFSKSAAEASSIASTSYVFAPASPQSEHLLVNMQPSTQFHVSAASGTTGTTVSVGTVQQGGSIAVSSNDQGVLRFALNGLTVVDDPDLPEPPAPPTQLDVN